MTRILVNMGGCVLVLALLLSSVEASGQARRLPALDRVRIVEPPRAVADAKLLDQEGRPFSIRELQGRVALVLFGFTNCPDVCPLTMESFRQVRESAEIDPARVAFVMISVDGERDTPEAMKAYVRKFSPDFIGLTGQPSAVKALASSFSAAFFKGSPEADGHYSVAHSAQVFAMDSEGRVRAELYGASVEAMSGIAQALSAEID